ncbi:hypothetical protein JHK85_041570 [Glycine max]|nr:hypothetical protein JHK85_041570 [Glycine max]
MVVESGFLDHRHPLVNLFEQNEDRWFRRHCPLKSEQHTVLPCSPSDHATLLLSKEKEREGTRRFWFLALVLVLEKRKRKQERKKGTVTAPV